MSSAAAGVFSRVIEWLLSLYQSAAVSIIDIVSGGSSDAGWLAKSWIGILVLLIIAGAAINLLIYFIRWKPHWWWFAKKRMIVDDALIENSRSKSADTKAKRKKKKSTAPTVAVTPSTIVKRKNSTESLNLSTLAPVPSAQDDALWGEDQEDLMELKPGRAKHKKA